MRAPIVLAAASIMLLAEAPSFACMPGNFSFAVGSARLNPRERWVIDDILREFRGRQRARIRLTATTDGTGPADANLRLARRRGEAVKTALVRHGIPARMIDVVAEGAGARRGADPYARQVSYEMVDAPTPAGDSDHC